MSSELLEEHAVRGVPHRHDTIITGTGQERPIRTPGHPAGRGRLFAGNPLAGTRGHLPPPNPPSQASTGPPPSLSTPPPSTEGTVGTPWGPALPSQHAPRTGPH